MVHVSHKEKRAVLEGGSAAGTSSAVTTPALSSLFRSVAAKRMRVVSAQVHYSEREAIVAELHCTFVS